MSFLKATASFFSRILQRINAVIAEPYPPYPLDQEDWEKGQEVMQEKISMDELLHEAKQLIDNKGQPNQ